MGIGLIFWILMLIWFVFGVALQGGWIAGPYTGWGNVLLLFILFLLLGWHSFGAPVHG
jgi:hypothetical protein